jgi:general nucleoside transport system ATP-binding protein
LSTLTPAPTLALALVDVVKRFGNVAALDRASLSVRPGTVHALLGENGAGKTTLMRIAFGMTSPNAGRLALFGRPAAWKSPADAIEAGIGMVHQHFTLVPAMTITENVELGGGARAASPGGIGRAWRFDRRAAEEHIRALGRAAGLAVDPRAKVAELSAAAQQRVEILKALRHDARVLILDEPTAVLAPREVDELLQWLRTYVGTGAAAVLITHKLREALAVADDVTVLRRGRTVLATARSAADERSLTHAMIGDDTDSLTTTPGAISVRSPDPSGGPTPTGGPIRPNGTPNSTPVAVLDEIVAASEGRRESIRATFAVYPGEVVGVAGVEGAGQHTLLRVLAGRVRPDAGRLSLPAPIGFIPEDRHRDALVLDFSLAENVALRGAGSRHGRMPWPAIRHRTVALMKELDVRAPGELTPARALSGGNQQRLILARELEGRPALLVVENPTQGLDVRAAAVVFERLQAARAAGTAIVFYSSDLDEVLALATRALVVYAGTVREVAPDRDLVGRAMLGLP